MAEFLRTLILTSEKGANIARTCRSEKELFALLIEEKTGKMKNQRFVQDFKTLADVLIQETIKHDIRVKFPDLAKNIHGEESNKFTNTQGETVYIEVKSTEQETCDLLQQVLGGDEEAAKLLAIAVHENINLEFDISTDVDSLDLHPNDWGIWIDPIDCTSEYIHGKENELVENDIYLEGLQCVTVLMGVYDLNTGIPIIGVINQPFFKQDHDSGRWFGQRFWGICHKGLCVNSLSRVETFENHNLRIVLSSSESDSLKESLCDCKLSFAAGAGYKLLCIFLGLADIYFLSKGTTFKWDCCAPHAILNSLGGGIVDMNKSLKHFGELTAENVDDYKLRYNKPNADQEGAECWSNAEGIIAYSNLNNLRDIINKIRKSLD